VKLFNDSVALAVMDAYPEIHFHPWKFRKTPVNWWKDLSEQFHSRVPTAEATIRQYIEDLALTHNIKTLDDWESFSQRTFPRSVTKHLQPFGGFGSVISRLYPSHAWKLHSRSHKKHVESELNKALTLAFPGEGTNQLQSCCLLFFFCLHSTVPSELLREVTPSKLKFIYDVLDHRKVETLRFDFVFPNLRLVFELQGQQHFDDTVAPGAQQAHIMNSSSKQPRINDALKRKLCEQNKFTLIEV